MKMLAPAGVLTLICAIAAISLAAVHGGTKGIIAEQERLFRLRSIKQSIPTYDNEPDQDVVVIGQGDDKICVFRGRQGDEVVGVAFERIATGGYSGSFKVLVGFTPEGQVACGPNGAGWVGLQVLQHSETPGLGAAMESDAWRRQFCGHTLDDGDTFWQVRKDGGQVDQLTGATITSRAVTGAIVNGLQFFQEHRDEILTGDGGSCEE
jgi:electron transport complex protein RnfG